MGLPPSTARCLVIAAASPWRHLVLASGRAFQRDRIRVVHEAIEDRVGDRRLAQIRVPLIARELARDDRRAGGVAILHHLEEVLALDVAQGGEPPVIEHQHVDAGESRQQGRVGAVGARERELLKEARQAPVDRAVPLPTGVLPERAADVGLADAGGAGDEDVVMFGDPAAGGELADQRPIEFAARRVVEILETRVRDPELGLLEPTGELAIVAREMLGIDEQADAFVEAERPDRRGPAAASDRRRPSRRDGGRGGGRGSVRSAWAVSFGIRRLVVGGPADVGMQRPRDRRRGLGVQGQTVQAVFENRLDVAIRPRAGGDRAGAGGVEPLGAVLLRQAEDAQARAIALLGMGPALEKGLDERFGVAPMVAPQPIKREGLHSRCARCAFGMWSGMVVWRPGR